MSYAVLFSGQGAQHPAMLPWLGTDPLIERMQGMLGVGDWRRALEDPAWAVRNRNAQLLLTGVGLAAAELDISHELADAIQRIDVGA